LKANWVAVVVGLHLSGNYEEAISTLTSYFAAAKLPAPAKRGNSGN